PLDGLHDMPSLIPNLSPAEADAGYWRSLADLAGSPEWQEANRPAFMPDVDSTPDGPSRRRFLQIMGPRSHSPARPAARPARRSLSRSGPTSPARLPAPPSSTRPRWTSAAMPRD